MCIQEAASIAHSINHPNIPKNPQDWYRVYAVSPTGRKKIAANSIEAKSAEEAIEFSKKSYNLNGYDLSRFTWKVEPSIVVTITYEKICWILPFDLPRAGNKITDSYNWYWTQTENWAALARQSELDVDFHLGEQNKHTGDFWVSTELFEAARSRKFAKL